MGITETLTALLKLFIMILPGVIAKKTGVITTEHTEGMSSFITHITYPCLVISSMQMEFSMKVLNNCKYVVLIFMGVILISLLLSRIIVKLVKLPKAQVGVLAFMLVFGNTGFVGLPVLNGLFGQEAVFYGALCDSSYDIFMFTLGIQLIASSGQTTGLKRTKKEILKSIFNPCLIGVLIGLSLYVLRITLPPILSEPVHTIGAVTSPLAMFVVGTHLANLQFKELLTHKYSYLICFMKLLVSPAIAFALVYFILGTGSLLASVLVMQASMPVAMCSVIFAQQFKGDIAFTTKGTLLSTLLCIFTIPLVAFLIV